MESWRRELYHYGVKGMKWGKHKTPFYKYEVSRRGTIEKAIGMYTESRKNNPYAHNIQVGYTKGKGGTSVYLHNTRNRQNSTLKHGREEMLQYTPADSYHSIGLPMGWMSLCNPDYTKYSLKERKGFNKWLFNSFASEPITISQVSPDTRVKVATNLLQNYGYFRGNVDYQLVDQRRPQKKKIEYDVNLGQPYLFDSIRYAFPYRRFADSRKRLIASFESICVRTRSLKLSANCSMVQPT